MSKENLDVLLAGFRVKASEYNKAIDRRVEYFNSLLGLFEEVRDILDNLHIRNYEFCGLGSTGMYIYRVEEETIDEYPKELRAELGDIVLTFAAHGSRVAMLNVDKKIVQNLSNDANKLITVLLLNAEDVIEMGLNRLNSGREW